MDSPLQIVICPICGGKAEKGCIYAGDRSDIRWLPGEPSWKNNFKAAFAGGEQVGEFWDLLAGTYVEAILYRECNHIVLEYKPPKKYFPDVSE